MQAVTVAFLRNTENQSFEAGAGAEAAAAGGVIDVGAAGRFGAGGGFLAAASAGVPGEAAASGLAALAPGWAGCCPPGEEPVPGSGTMMLTAGVEAALGNSALVGLPVGNDGPPGASPARGTIGCGGAFHSGT
jgi:hypothetical protein